MMVEFHFYMSEKDFDLLAELKDQYDIKQELTYNEFASKLLHSKLLDELTKNINKSSES